MSIKAEDVVYAIIAGCWRDKGEIPTQRDIAEMCGLSLYRTHVSIGKLAADGRLNKLPGKSCAISLPTFRGRAIAFMGDGKLQKWMVWPAEIDNPLWFDPDMVPGDLFPDDPVIVAATRWHDGWQGVTVRKTAEQVATP